MMDSSGVSAGSTLSSAPPNAATAGASAQSVEDFYRGRTVSLIMGTGPGGSYDLYGRLIAQHLPRFIPGNPNIVVEHMPGAGGATAGNYIFGPAPQDGSKILLAHALPLIEKLSAEHRAALMHTGTIAQIGAELGWKEGTVKSRVHRARNELARLRAEAGQ